MLKERRQFGQPIASFQMVQAMLADMAIKVETARLMVLKACWMRDEGMEFSKEAAMAEMLSLLTLLCSNHRCCSSNGWLWLRREYPVEKNDA